MVGINYKMLTFNTSSNTFTSSLFPKNITHGFGTRMSGNGRNLEDIKKYLIDNGIEHDRVIDPDQQHTTNIELVMKDTPEYVTNCDGLITTNRETVLTVITADCAPIIYHDPRTKVIAISHNGRKGTEQGLARTMIRKFMDLHSNMQDIRAAIGPSIGACCYPVNLVKENVEQILAMGITEDHIDFFPFCTKCDSKRFFSYRGSNIKENFPEQFSFISIS